MATRPSWTVIDAAFDHALDLDGDDRQAYLASLDPEVQAALAPLLRDAARELALIDRPEAVVEPLVRSGDATTEEDPRPAAVIRIGAYGIESLVGEGGMGRVYRAHRADGAFAKTVALKVVRQSLALAGADVAARLRRERDLLAALDHPGIARLLDGGETDDGVPYLVTEFVDGAPITDWADAHVLGVRDRVRLVAEVAWAVDHAHRRFVVHRDLKPSNVLVTEADGVPRPVVLDFGIAKLLEAAEDESSAAFPLTRTGMRLLTPAYAAPELYAPTATVTTAADVYGLGALLYEMLTGRRPHDDGPDRPGPPITEPTRPSKVVTGPPSGVDRASFDASQRSRQLRGDLDVICLRALHPDPARRYASAAALADDLERYLEGRPVEARRDSVAYVVGRFVRRNRALVAAAGVAVAALVVGLAVALASLSNERAARAEALSAVARAEEAASLLGSVFDDANPRLTEGRTVTVDEALDQALGRVAAVESDALRGYLLTTLGRTYLDAGETARADSLLALAVETLGSAGGDLQANAMLWLGHARSGDGWEAIDLFVRALGLASHSDASRVRFDLALALSEEFMTAPNAGLMPAKGYSNLALDLAGDRPELRAEALAQKGRLAAYGSDFPTAIAAYEEATRLLERTYGRNSVRLLATLGPLGSAMRYTAREPEWEGLQAQALQIARRVYGTDHPVTLSQLTSYAYVAAFDKRYADAEPRVDSAYAVALRTLSLNDGALSDLLSLRAEVKNGVGDHAAAVSSGQEAIRLARVWGDSVGVAQGQVEVAIARAGQGERAEARSRLQTWIPRLGAGDWMTRDRGRAVLDGLGG